MSPSERKQDAADLLAAARLVVAITIAHIRLRRLDRHDMQLAVRRMRALLDRIEQAASDRQGDCLCGRPIALHFRQGRKLDCREVRA